MTYTPHRRKRVSTPIWHGVTVVPPLKKPPWYTRTITFTVAGFTVVLGWREGFMLGVAVAAGLLMISMRLAQLERLEALREEIRFQVERKGFEMDDPAIRTRFGKIAKITKMEELQSLLDEAIKMAAFTAIPPPKPNPTDGSYLEYLQSSGKAFDNAEAIKWLAVSYRNAAPTLTPTAPATPVPTPSPTPAPKH